MIGVLFVLIASFVWFKIYFESVDVETNQIVAQNLQVEKIDLTDYKGKPMVVNCGVLGVHLAEKSGSLFSK